jgi:hypothetical protein
VDGNPQTTFQRKEQALMVPIWITGMGANRFGFTNKSNILHAY